MAVDRSHIADLMVSCVCYAAGKAGAYGPPDHNVEPNIAVFSTNGSPGIICFSDWVLCLVGKHRVFVYRQTMAGSEIIGSHPLIGLSHHYCKEYRRDKSDKKEDRCSVENQVEYYTDCDKGFTLSSIRGEGGMYPEPENDKPQDVEISVIIPVYNEEHSIGHVVSGVREVLIEEGLSFEILVVDDGSADGTKEKAEEEGAVVLTHAYNIGNGAAVKTGIRAANGEVVVFLDGDGQHDPEDIPRLLNRMDGHVMVVGARTRGSDTDAHRDFGNRIYNWLASYVCNRKIEDLTSGFRVVRADKAREFLHLLPNTFSYPSTLTLAVARCGYQFAYQPIKVSRRKGKSKINLLQDGLRFLLIIFKVTTLFSPLKIFIPASLGLFFLGFGYGLYKVLVLDMRYGPTSALLMTMSGLVFLIGLVSEQLTQLRYEK